MKIVVLAGGISTERAVSLVTGSGVCRALRQNGHRAILVDLFLGLKEVPADLEALFDAPDGLCPDAKIEVRGNTLPYVSRGGFKLEKALKVFPIDPTGLTCIDCGASTGGFTDVLLQNGAAKVYAVDVGYGQLAWSLRQDPRVKCMERTNIRYVTPDMLEETPSFCVIDVSFIFLKLVLPVVSSLLTEDGHVANLIKPQFEAGREKVGKKGVVRDRTSTWRCWSTSWTMPRNPALQSLG